MKKIVRNTTLVALMIFGGASLMSFSEDTIAPLAIESVEQGPQIVFESKEFNFGSINQGDKVEHTFIFKNEGDAPLMVNNAKGSCGCTVPQWPKEPIMPGATGEIHVVFNSAGKSGRQTKTVTLTTNQADATTVLYLKGEVIVASTPAAPSTPGEH